MKIKRKKFDKIISEAARMMAPKPPREGNVHQEEKMDHHHQDHKLCVES